MASQSGRSSDDCARWVQRVHGVQSRRSPEACEAASVRIEQARQLEVSYRNCQALSSHAYRSQALCNESLRQMSLSSAPAEYTAVQTRWRSAQDASLSRQQCTLATIEAPASAASPFDTTVTRLQNAAESDASALLEVASLVGAAEPRSLAVGGGLASAGGELLQQLRQEPEGAAECAAKFSLYEGYASEVGQMRSTLLKFHEDSRPTVPPAVGADMDRQVKSIDSVEAMGIQDGMREWFVFHMMRQAQANNVKMTGILGHFEKKLEFLSANDQAECPVCLEVFADSGDHVSETLGCCHKVCKDCWEHWSVLMKGRPFCPLCRHDEFLGAVASNMRSGGLA